MENNIEKKTKLLVVDDDLTTSITIRDSLKKYGYSRIATAKNGDEAIQLVKECPPDLILMDINQEGELDGIQTSEKINEIAEIPIIFVTASSHNSTIQSTKHITPYGYLIKPIEKLVLYSTIEMALNRFSLEKQLKHSEAKFRALFANNRDAIGVSKSGIHLFANPSYLKLFGFENHDMIVGKSILDCIAPSHKEKIIEYVKLRASGDETPTFYESRGRRTDGSEFDFEINVSTYELDNEVYTIAHIRDITERLKAEKEIDQSRYFFKDSQSAAFIGSYKTDFIAGKWESSEVLDKIFGIDKNYDRSVKGWLDLTHPEDNKMMDDYLREEVFAKQKTFDREYRIIRKSDRQIRWVHGLGKVEFNSDGNLVSMIGTIQDITERKKSEEDVRLNVEHLKSLLEILQYQAVSIQEFLDHALEEAIAITRSKIGYIYHYSEKRNEFVLNSWSKEVMKECTIVQQQTVYQLERTGIWGEAVRQRKPIVLNDFQSSNNFKKGYPEGHAHLNKFLTVPVFINNQIVGVVGVANKETDYDDTDVLQLSLLMDAVWKVVDRKKVEGELFESNAILQAAMDQSPAGIAIANAPDGTLRYVNNTGLLIRGGDRQAIIEGVGIDKYVSSWKLLDLDGRPLNTEEVPLARAVMYGETSSREFVIRRHENDDRIVLANAAPIKDENGKTTSGIVVFTDITERKQAEVKLKESELRFRELYDNAPVGLYRTTPDGKILLANKALCSMLGYYSFKELSEMDLKKSGYESADQRKIFIEEIDKLGEVKDLEAKWKRKDGSTLIVKESAKIVRDDLNNILYYDGTVEDITERKLIEETQMFLLNSFNTDSSGDFFTSLAVYLAKCLDMDYVCIDKLYENNLAAKTLAIYFDGKFEDNVDYTLKETPCGDVVGKTICCFPQKVRHLFPKDIVLQEMKAESYIGTTLWSSNHLPIGLIAVIGRKPLENRHLAETILKLVAIRCAGELERRHAEKEILEKEIQYHNLADSGIALIWTSGLDKLCNYFNEPWLKFTGRTIEQEMGTGWTEGVHPEDFDHCLKTYVEAFDKREAFDMEYRLRHVSGEYRWLKDMGVPNYNAAGEFVGYIGHCFDINEQKKTEKTIKELNERITLATRVAKIGIWDWDIVNNVLLWDENMYSLYGRKENEFDGAYNTWLNAIHPDDKDRCNLESELARNGEKDYNTEFRITVPDKGIRYIRAYGDVYRNDKGEPFRMIGVNFDITERKTDELLLKKSEEKFSKAFETSPEAISISSMEDGTYLEVNNVFIKTTGYSREELIGHTSREIGIWVDKDGRQNYITELLTKGSLKNYETRFRMKNGEIRDFWVSCQIIELEGKRCSLNFILDVTERKKAEEALQESEMRFKQVAENAKEWIWEVDKNGLYTYASKVSNELLGYDPDEIVGKKYFHDLFIEKDREELKNFAFKTFERKEQFSGFLNVNLHKDGREIILSTSGVPILNNEGDLVGYRGVDVDITESKLAEEELKSSFSLLNATLESTADGILVVNSIGTINLCNQQFINMWKIPKELIDKKDDKLLLEHVVALVDKPEEFLSKINELYSKPDESSFDIIHLTGESVFERYSRPQKIGDTIVGRVWSFRDITERRRVRKELEKYQVHLEELVKVRTEELNNVNSALIRKIEKENEFKLMLQHSLEKEKELSEMKSQFIATASHEFRTPLTSILSSAGLLQRYSKQWGDEKKGEHFERIKNSVSYITKLLDDVLTLNRVESGKIKLVPDYIDLKEFAVESVDELKHNSELHQLNLFYNTSQLKFMLDQKLLKFIFSNLISNAIKFSPEGGKIDINISTNENFLILQVSDEGIGIRQEDLQKIFDSFYRSREVENISGNGLGLAIVKRAVDLHKGEIIVNSALNKGTSFTVRIPLKN